MLPRSRCATERSLTNSTFDPPTAGAGTLQVLVLLLRTNSAAIAAGATAAATTAGAAAAGTHERR